MPRGVYGEKQPCWQFRKDLWSEERTALLKQWWRDRISASVIADRLNRTTDGHPLTRCSVLGRVHRLGLSGTHPRPKLSNPRPRSARPRPSIPAPARPPKLAPDSVATLPPPLPEPEPLFVIDIPQHKRCTLAMLTRHTCRWPMGDPGSPDFYFCGRQPEPGHSYCAYHCCIAYQSVAERRAQRKASGFVEAAE